MTKVDKLISKLVKKPKDFTYDELVSVLVSLGYEEIKKGKTSGSRRAFVHSITKHIIRLHKPHPQNTLKKYVLDYIVAELEDKGL